MISAPTNEVTTPSSKKEKPSSIATQSASTTNIKSASPTAKSTCVTCTKEIGTTITNPEISSKTKDSNSTSLTDNPSSNKNLTSTSSTDHASAPALPPGKTVRKGKFQFDENPIWFCAAGIKYCMAPHVEVGKNTIHTCASCKEKVHTFCISKNYDGVMLCSGCDVLHAYTDAIKCQHPMDPVWKRKLITYYQNKSGIPKGVSFFGWRLILAITRNS